MLAVGWAGSSGPTTAQVENERDAQAMSTIATRPQTTDVAPDGPSERSPAIGCHGDLALDREARTAMVRNARISVPFTSRLTPDRADDAPDRVKSMRHTSPDRMNRNQTFAGRSTYRAFATLGA